MKAQHRFAVENSRGHAGSRQFCVLANVVVCYVRRRKHSEARHSAAQHGTARHRTALRRAVELAKLSGAGVLFSCFQLAGCDLRKNESMH